MFSSSLVMSSTLLKIGVRKEDEQGEEEGGRVGSGENGRVVYGTAKSVTNACYCHVHQIVILNWSGSSNCHFPRAVLFIKQPSW